MRVKYLKCYCIYLHVTHCHTVYSLLDYWHTHTNQSFSDNKISYREQRIQNTIHGLQWDITPCSSLLTSSAKCLSSKFMSGWSLYCSSAEWPLLLSRPPPPCSPPHSSVQSDPHWDMRCFVHSFFNRIKNWVSCYEIRLWVRQGNTGTISMRRKMN